MPRQLCFRHAQQRVSMQRHRAVFSVRRHGGVPRARSSLAHRSGPPADAAPPVRWHLRFAGFMLVSVPQSRIIRTAGGDLIRRRARAGVRRVRLVQLDVPARQYPRRHDDSADAGIGRADTGQLQSELVHSLPGLGSELSSVLALNLTVPKRLVSAVPQISRTFEPGGGSDLLRAAHV